MNPLKVLKDKFGVKIKYPERECKICQKYPCFAGIERCKSDFAKFGCIYYKEPRSDRW